MASYDFKILGADSKVQINVNNIFDERYYPATYYSSVDRIEVGTPRSVIASLSLRF